MWSAGNSLTLVVEDEVNPYKKEQGKPVKTRDMNLHALPWPKSELEYPQGEIVCAFGLTTSVVRSKTIASPIPMWIAGATKSP